MNPNEMLITAVENGDAAAISEAIKNGAGKVNAASAPDGAGGREDPLGGVHADGDFALCWAAEFERIETVKLLLDCGADKVNAASAPDGAGGREDPLGGVHAKDDEAFHYATVNECTEVLQLLKTYL